MDYKVRFVNYPKHYQNMKTEIDAAVTEILSHGDFILRSHLRDFEKNMADFLGVKYTIGVNNGTDAIFFSLLAAGVGKGDEVITPAHTFVATIAGIVHCGATPILIDIGDDMNMDVNQVEQLITSKTKAIMPVHLNGRLCDMGKLMKIAEKHDLIVIEDAAQALGATHKGKMGGSFGLAGCFSFYPAKILGTAGDAGLVSTNDKEFADQIFSLRDNGRIIGSDDINGFGYNSRLDNLHAAMLNVKFKYLHAWITRRREIAQRYQEGLSDIPELTLPPSPDAKGPFFDVFQNYVIRSKRRDELAAFLRNSGVEIIISWPVPLNKQPKLGLQHFRLPVTEKVSNEVISLPLYPELEDDQVEYVIDVLHDFHEKK
ncbi:MAG: DegT/DnrJ/EryC1/StrS family aminotransferase [Euryarchaeota archaeon]|nr:DegT/DnrJ/EryC1/StrS family aminotransferase [Euryarchaeota archaeon]